MKERKAKEDELKVLMETAVKSIWEQELDNFLEVYDVIVFPINSLM